MMLIGESEILKYYNNYIDNIAMSPNEEHRNLTNHFVKEQWHDTTLLKKVHQETAVGSFTFKRVEVWKNTVTEFTNNIQKDAKDFRRLMFKTDDEEIERGRFFRFNKNFWITYEATNEEEPYHEVLVRRCNNVAKWIDKDTGKLIEQPCVLDYYLSATNPKVDKDIIVANNSTMLVLQGNEHTRKLKPNQRFIFNGQPFKFVAINNYMQNDYIDKDVTILFIDIDFDPIKPSDDIENNVADAFEYGYKPEQPEVLNGIIVDPIYNSISEQDSVTFGANLYLNGVIQEDIVNYSVSGANSDCYTLTRNGNNFTITNHKRSDVPLVIDFSCLDEELSLTIELEALF